MLTPPEGFRAALLGALRSGAADDLAPLLAADVTWAECSGRDDVLATFQAMAVAFEVAGLELDSLEDRIVATVAVTNDGQVSESYHALFLRDGLISEIISDPQRDGAAKVRPVGDLGGAAERPVRLDRTSPILPVSDVEAAAAHYRALGFDVQAYDGAPYAFASWDGNEIHLAQVSDLDPLVNNSAVYLYVDDADALYARWRSADLGGRMVAPVDTDYGLREGAHVDPDGNLLRFGSGSV